MHEASLSHIHHQNTLYKHRINLEPLARPKLSPPLHFSPGLPPPAAQP